jgi:hypothetical protein
MLAQRGHALGYSRTRSRHGGDIRQRYNSTD